MADAQDLRNPKLLLAWSATLNTVLVSFDDFVNQTEGSVDADNSTYGSCADAQGHSVRVPPVAEPATV